MLLLLSLFNSTHPILTLSLPLPLISTMMSLTPLCCFFLLLSSVDSSKRDVAVLLGALRSQLHDPQGLLHDWLASAPDAPCSWTGISCPPASDDVVSIDLSSLGLYGNFPADFCRISTLRSLNISDNFLGGTINSSSLSLCSHLNDLNLSSNYFVGSLPELKTPLINLTALDVSANNFTGDIPSSFGYFLPKLQVVNFRNCLFNGSIPEFLYNLTELIELRLDHNLYQPTTLHPNIGRLTKLQVLQLQNANLVGTIPEGIFDLISLKLLDLSTNNLTGRVSPNIGNLKNVEMIELFLNNLSGELPDTFSNLTSLRMFDASQNKFSGRIPESLAALPLVSFNLNDNSFGGEIPEVLALNPNLNELKLFSNNLTGSIPADLGKNSPLEQFDVSMNNLEGPVPPNLCYMKKLQTLLFFENRVTGNIPEVYGECTTITRLRIQSNELSGTVPEGLWSIPGLDHLELRNNRLQGSIPPSIGKAKVLNQLLISGNNFSGAIPEEICELEMLDVADISRNRFSGQLPSCIGKLKKLEKFEGQENEFQGEIPEQVGSWSELTELNLSNNQLSGEIPRQLGSLPVLTYLDLSKNLLSGKIPVELAKLTLNSFNLSGNRLEGRIPSGFDQMLYSSSFNGNRGLCSSSIKSLPPCTKAKRGSVYMIAVLSVLAVILLGLLICLLMKAKKLRAFGNRNKRLWKVTSFQRVGFNEEDLLAALTDENLIGTGGSGLVYRLRLKNGQTVAVKRLWGLKRKPESEEVFRSEVETLGTIRHGNIVKLLYSCIGEDFRVLVYEYMQNGSLGDVLHGDKGGVLLDWTTRSAIAIGAAQGLAYLHHDCVPAIVHRDIKSNNILLDEEYRPKVADFGLAKILQKDLKEENPVMSRIAGSYGYIAPEYAYTLKVNEKSDVYSYGVLLMELITGKRPNDSSFGENKDIVKWITESVTSYPNQGGACATKVNGFTKLNQLVDPRMDPSTFDQAEIMKAMDVAIRCTSALPTNRPSMKRVVEMLRDRPVTSPK